MRAVLSEVRRSSCSLPRAVPGHSPATPGGSALSNSRSIHLGLYLAAGLLLSCANVSPASADAVCFGGGTGALPGVNTETACGPVGPNGDQATAEGDNATAVGAGSYALGIGTTAIGTNSFAGDLNGLGTGTNATALGTNSFATGTNSISIGNQEGPSAGAFGSGSIAIGHNAQAGTDPTGTSNSIAIGTGAIAEEDNSVAIGAGATTDAANQIKLGTATTDTVVGGTLTVNGNTTTNGIDNNSSGITDAGAISGATTIDATGNITTTTGTVSGAALTATSGGANITGGINNNGDGITDAGAISGATTIDATGNISSSGEVSGATLKTTAAPAATAGASNIAAINADGTVAKTDATIDADGSVNLNGANVNNAGTVNANAVNSATVNTGTATIGTANVTTANVGGDLTVTGAAAFNGGATVKSSFAVVGPANVSMGNNIIHDVAGPVVGTDAANKDYVDAGLNEAFKKIDENTEGIAVAIALGGIALPQGKDFAVAANLGFYDGKEAIAAQTAIRLDQTFTLNGGIGAGFDNNKVGGRVGIMAAW